MTLSVPTSFAEPESEAGEPTSQQQQHPQRPVEAAKLAGDTKLASKAHSETTVTTTTSKQQEADHNNDKGGFLGVGDQLRPAKGDPTSTTTAKLDPTSMFLREAMRYYRIWIYSSNVCILLATTLFLASVAYVSSDYRVSLLVRVSYPPPQTAANATEAPADPRLHLLEPAALVGALAILVQAGALQALGCYGALRMKERWVQAYWLLILALTLLDLGQLVYWLQRYDQLARSLGAHMAFRLERDYAHDNTFTVSPRRRTY